MEQHALAAFEIADGVWQAQHAGRCTQAATSPSSPQPTWKAIW
jgi:hypothetical protein